MTTAQKERILKAERRKDLQILIDIADSRTARIVAELRHSSKLDPVYAAGLRRAIRQQHKNRRLAWPR